MTTKAFRMVLGVDTHQDCAELLWAAQRIAARLQARVDVVEVLPFPSPDLLAAGWAGGPAAGLPPVEIPEDPVGEDSARDELCRRVAATAGFDSIAWDAHVVRGAVATELTRFAQKSDADLIAVGAPSSGWSEWLHHLLAGSVLHDLERTCPVPLLLLPSAAPHAR
jgi:nucleotide-binding universal stress UspA family protein